MSKCKRCVDAGQPDNFASPRKCAFLSGEFSVDNWQCATMNALRDIAEDVGVSWRIADSSFGAMPFDDDFGRFLVMTWYKDRGRTSRAYVMCDDVEPELLTIAVAEQILDVMEKK